MSLEKWRSKQCQDGDFSLLVLEKCVYSGDRSIGDEVWVSLIMPLRRPYPTRLSQHRLHVGAIECRPP
jgi:hypothetical protein